MNDNNEKLAKMFKELGHPKRLEIVKILIKKGFKGLSVGELQVALGIPNSTLSHHISCLKTANILIQKRDKRTLMCIVNFEEIDVMTDFFVEGCCKDQ